MGNRFDYVKYDGHAINLQEAVKKSVQELETLVDCVGANFHPGASARSRALAITKLEEAYMWIGKAIRDDQIARNEHTKPQEERTNS